MANGYFLIAKTNIIHLCKYDHSLIDGNYVLNIWKIRL